MAKVVTFDVEARQALKKGIDIVASSVRITLGPKGRNVVLEKKFGAPTVTNDGVTIVREIELKDAMENTGAQLLREVATKSTDVAGDGATTATILAQTMISEGFRNVAAGANPMQLKIGIEKAVSAIVDEIKRRSVPVKGHEGVAHAAASASPHESGPRGPLRPHPRPQDLGHPGPAPRLGARGPARQATSDRRRGRRGRGARHSRREQAAWHLHRRRRQGARIR